MKKQLLLASIAFITGMCAEAQTLQSDNFDALTVGNIGATLDGNTAGQGGWYTYAANQGAASNFQIVTETGRGNVLSIEGVNVASGTSQATDNARFLWKGAVNWASRTTGNNVARFEVDFFTGGTTTSKNFHNMAILNSQGRMVVGFQYSPSNKLLIGLTARYVAGSTTDTETIGVALTTVNGTGAGVTLAANTWVKVICYINYNTGVTTYQVPSMNINGTFNNSLYTGAGATTFAPAEVDFVAVGGAANTASSTLKYDNYLLTATNSETASVDSRLLEEFKIFPNPTTGIINFTKNDNVEVNSIEFTDLNGRVVKTVKTESFSDVQIDISDLNTGVYLMNINTNEGMATKKIIKK